MPWKELLDEAQKGVANGLATLDANAKVPESQITDIPGIMYVYRTTFQFTDLEKGVAKLVKTLEANSIVWSININVKVAFNDSGVDLLDVGKTNNSNYFKSNLDISSTGMKNINDAEYPYLLPAQEDITITYNCENSDADEGVLEIFMLYSLA